MSFFTQNPAVASHHTKKKKKKRPKFFYSGQKCSKWFAFLHTHTHTHHHLQHLLWFHDHVLLFAWALFILPPCDSQILPGMFFSHGLWLAVSSAWMALPWNIDMVYSHPSFMPLLKCCFSMIPFQHYLETLFHDCFLFYLGGSFVPLHLADFSSPWPGFPSLHTFSIANFKPSSDLLHL